MGSATGRINRMVSFRCSLSSMFALARACTDFDIEYTLGRACASAEIEYGSR